MAEDKDLDITRIKGTGGNDRITKLDIQRVESEGYDYEGEAGTSTKAHLQRHKTSMCLALVKV